MAYMMKWISTQACPEKTSLLIEALRIEPLLASLLLRQGKESPEDAEAFLDPRLAHLDDPFNVSYLKSGAERIVQAIQQGQQVCVMGDYDVDGVTGTTLLVSVLQHFGLSPRYLIPRRMEEGYGLNMDVLERLLSNDPIDLLVVVDSGTNAIEPVAALRKKNIDVMILDHHRSKDGLPQDCILINPHVHDSEDKPWKHLCSVGLVFKLVHGILKLLREQNNTKANDFPIKSCLDLVAMGTIADLMPLTGENRIFAKHGLEQLSQTALPGIQALFEASGMVIGQEVNPGDVSFKLGPRINASGRLADAALPVEMFLSKNFAHCLKAARSLDKMNKERQAIEQQITEEARSMIEAEQKNAKGFVVYSEEWHTGVVGIVSGKLSRDYNRPCIVLGREFANGEEDLIKGSGRSIKGINLVEALSLCDHLLEGWGGHPMAVGVSLKEDNFTAFREAFSKILEDKLPHGLPEKTLEIAHWVSLKEINEKLMTSLDRLRPFGEGNPEPIFGVKAVMLQGTPLVINDKHYRFTLASKKGYIKGIAWNKAHNLPPDGKLIDIAFRLQWNEWNGKRNLQLLLMDWRLSE